jgi:hypothetical protein
VNKRVLDYEGAVPTSAMRTLFERVIHETSQFRDALDITPEMKGGQFDGYKDEDTNMLWVGFAIGVRCSARIADAGKRIRKGVA